MRGVGAVGGKGFGAGEVVEGGEALGEEGGEDDAEVDGAGDQPGEAIVGLEEGGELGVVG